MLISGMSGNEIYCLRQKGFSPGEIALGNSVVSLGISGAIGSFGRQLAGGEITAVTEMISSGRHAAILRMEQEAKKHGANGVTGVVTGLGTLAGYTEFLSQGTGVHAESPSRFFSTAASGIELYCHLDAGYRPIRFSMGNIAYALGVGRGLIGSVRTLARGEVREFSSMYNEIRHTALRRLRLEAASYGANAVVDVQIRMIPHGPGTVELLLTGTASHHDGFSTGVVVNEQNVVTSELSGEALWNLAQLGLVPHQLVMATSVYSLGVAGSIGSMFQAITRGELPDLTRLIYEARENCLELVRREATQLGADRVIGNRLQIREIGPGLVEVVAIGTAVKKADATFLPTTPQLIPQAVIVERRAVEEGDSVSGFSPAVAPMNVAQAGARQAGSAALQVVIVVFFLGITCLVTLFTLIFGHR